MDLQIVKQDTQFLEVKAKPETILVVFIGIWCLGFGGLPLTYLPFLTSSLLYEMGTKTLTCERQSKTINCQAKADKFFGLAEPVTWTLPPITSAKFNRFKSPKSDPVYWMTLIDQKGKAIALFPNEWEPRGLTSDAVTIQSWVDQINQLIKSPPVNSQPVKSQQPSLTLTYPVTQQWSSLWILFFFLLFPAIGVTVLYIVFQTHTIICDRTSQTITWQRSTLFGKSSKLVDWDVVRRLEIKQRKTSKGQIYYELIWLTQDGIDLPRLNNNSRDLLVTCAEAIANFLNLSIDDHTRPNR